MPAASSGVFPRRLRDPAAALRVLRAREDDDPVVRQPLCRLDVVFVGRDNQAITKLGLRDSLDRGQAIQRQVQFRGVPLGQVTEITTTASEYEDGSSIQLWEDDEKCAAEVARRNSTYSSGPGR